MPAIDLNSATAVYRGGVEVDAVYRGSVEIWRKPQATASLKPGTLTNPPVSMQLGNIYDPGCRIFLNAFKQAGAWEEIGTWYEGVTNGYITAGGQVLAVPPGASVVTRCLQSAPAESGATGRWRLRWTGSAVIDVYGLSNMDTSIPNEVWGDFTANGSNYVTIAIRSKGSAPLTDFSFVKQEDIPDFEAGKIFRQAYLDDLRNYRCLRFAGWMNILEWGSAALPPGQTQGLSVHDWASRALPSDEMFFWRGVPYEWQCALCNEIGADGWFNMPTAATDDHFTQAATLIRSLMPAPRHVYAEYSTKTWDPAGSPQFHYCSLRGQIEFGTSDGDEYMNWYGMRSAQHSLAWKAVWTGADAARLHTVIQVQTDFTGMEDIVLSPPKWQAQSGLNGLPVYVAPHDTCDMLTIHAQVDGGMSYGDGTTVIDNWRTTLSQTDAFDRMRDQMIDPGLAMTNYPSMGHYVTNGSGYDVERAIQQELATRFAYFAAVANSHGMEIGCYEVGSHINGAGDGMGGARTAFLTAFSASAQMGQVFTAAFNALRAAGFDGPICASVHTRLPDTNSISGISRWLGDHNAAWSAFETINLVNNGPSGRAAGDFVGTNDLA